MQVDCPQCKTAMVFDMKHDTAILHLRCVTCKSDIIANPDLTSRTREEPAPKLPPAPPGRPLLSETGTFAPAPAMQNVQPLVTTEMMAGGQFSISPSIVGTMCAGCGTYLQVQMPPPGRHQAVTLNCPRCGTRKNLAITPESDYAPHGFTLPQQRPRQPHQQPQQPRPQPQAQTQPQLQPQPQPQPPPKPLPAPLPLKDLLHRLLHEHRSQRVAGFGLVCAPAHLRAWLCCLHRR
jgi:hypothetical protein